MSLTTPMRQKTEYSTIPADEFLSERGEPEFKGWQWARRYFITILISIFALTAIILFRDFETHLSPNKSHDFEWIPCGNTSAEARFNNCHFDPMLISWVPEACYIAEPADEYDVSEFKWFADAKRTQPLDQNLVQNGDYDHVFTDGSHHDQHCIYTWRKLSIALERRLPMLDTKTADFHHSTHCAKGVRGVVHDALNMVDGYKGTYSSIPLAFQGCVPLFF
ncbi:hypothetical protein B7494_g3025 [Chlorociboria aeruginascens]|nr:hypothetical protein B7494_g3025 [Chlorociboria aeruginascens]